MKKNVKFVLPKPSNNDNLNTDFSSRLEYYDDEKNGILNIVRIKPRPSIIASKNVHNPTSKSTAKTPKSTPKTPKSTPKTSKSTPKTPKSTPKTPKSTAKTSKSTPKTPKSTSKTPKSTSKTNRKM